MVGTMMSEERRMRRGKYRVKIPDLDYYQELINCQFACPVRTDARAYVRAIADGDYERAYLIARESNPFASVCGRVCNAPCEANCRRGVIDAPVAIRALKRFVTERYGVESSSYSPEAIFEGAGPGDSRTARDLTALKVLAEASRGSSLHGGKVAIIGAGPAGLSAAHDLAILGHRVTVFEASSVPGGMLYLGIPEYRLPRALIEAEIQAILDLGVELRLNTPIGPDFGLADLRAQGYEAIFIAIGAHRSLELGIEGVHLDGVLRATDFLLNVNLGYRVELGNRVLVVGGGNVAIDAARSVLRQMERIEEMSPEEMRLALEMAWESLRQVAGLDGRRLEDLTTAIDAARSALRLGVREVSILYRRSRREMPARPEEIEEAEREGIHIRYLTNPVRILGENGRVRGVECVRMRLGEPDASGRRRPIPIEGSEFTLEADTVIMAIGQTPDLSFIQESDGIEVTRQGWIAVDSQSLATTAPGVFAGGDAAFGPRIVIEAIADGQRAARSIDEYLRGKRTYVVKRATMTPLHPFEMPEGYHRIGRRSVPTLPVERRIGIDEVELGYDEEMALEQAKRCLRCQVNTVFDSEKCILCGGCVDVCPEYCLKMLTLDRLEGDEDVDRLIQAKLGPSLVEFQRRSGDLHLLSEGTAMIKDEERCIRCGLCAERCPTGAITMEAFAFREELAYEG
jgi:NADPH-dependent glutamate synthase beta subunit-like oxidoreductase